jgi:hypothetical protein
MLHRKSTISVGLDESRAVRHQAGNGVKGVSPLLEISKLTALKSFPALPQTNATA